MFAWLTCRPERAIPGPTTRTIELPPHNPHAACPKCPCDAVGTQHIEGWDCRLSGIDLVPPLPVLPDEWRWSCDWPSCLKRWCRRCGYVWRELTADGSSPMVVACTPEFDPVHYDAYF